jgi:hypothetical protein
MLRITVRFELRAFWNLVTINLGDEVTYIEERVV